MCIYVYIDLSKKFFCTGKEQNEMVPGNECRIKIYFLPDEKYNNMCMPLEMSGREHIFLIQEKEENCWR